MSTKIVVVSLCGCGCFFTEFLLRNFKVTVEVLYLEKNKKNTKKQVSRARGIVGHRQNVKLVVRRTKLREFMESSTSGSVKFV